MTTRLPHARSAVIEASKITGYLLSESHPAGRFKAAYFRRCGFSPSAWRTLHAALLAHAAASDVVAIVETEFGTKYIVEGDLALPDGGRAHIRTVWFVDLGDDAPRLATAYPARGDEG